MPTWAGWQSQFLTAAGLIVTPPNMRFLTEWAQNATHNCGNNPIDMSEPMPGATNCADNTGVLLKVKHYQDHRQAANAFKFELLYPWADAIRKALDSGNPYQFKGSDTVVSDLISWGSVKYANVYQAATAPTGGGGGGGGHIKDAHLLHGWESLQQSLGHHMVASLRDAEKSRRSALRSLARARKVRI